MTILFAVVLIFLSLLIHELGHAKALSSRGVFVQEIGLGIPYKKVPTVAFRLGKIFPGTIFRFSPLLLGAYVKYDDEDEAFKNFSVSDKVEVFGAGILANLLFAIFLYVVWLFVIAITKSINVFHPMFLKHIAVAATVGLIVWFGRRFLYFLIPIIGTAFVMVAIYLLMTMDNCSEGLGGPITIGIMTSKYSKTFLEAIWWGMIVSLSLSLTNAIPFSFLDGEKIIKLFLEKVNNKRVTKTFEVAALAGIYLMIGTSLFFDVIHLKDFLMS